MIDEEGCLQTLEQPNEAQDVHPQSRSPALSPEEDTQSPWAEETLDGSFLGSGEELDLLSEILDSLSMETKSGGRSLDCCQQGTSESCFSLVGPLLRPPNLSIPSPT